MAKCFKTFCQNTHLKKFFKKIQKKDDANKRMQTSGCKPLRFHTRVAVSICALFLKYQFGSLLQTQKKKKINFETNLIFCWVRTWSLCRMQTLGTIDWSRFRERCRRCSVGTRNQKSKQMFVMICRKIYSSLDHNFAVARSLWSSVNLMIKYEI